MTPATVKGWKFSPESPLPINCETLWDDTPPFTIGIVVPLIMALIFPVAPNVGDVDVVSTRTVPPN